MEIMGGRPFTRATARVHGVTGHQVERLLAGGAVRQPARGVYIAACAPDDLPTRAACLAVVLPKNAAVCRRTAAWLWGIDTRMPGHLDVPLPVECVVPVGCEPISRIGVRSYVADLEPTDITDMDGVPCTTPLRTAVDLLRWLPPHMALGSADALAHAGLIAVSELVEAVELWAGHPGVIQARRLAGLVEPLTESFGESWLRLRVIDAGFPRPEPQIKVFDRAGRLVYRLDLGWESRRKALEYNGEEFHSGRPAQQADDARLGRLKREFDWDVVPVGRGEVLGRSLALERGVGELLGLEPQIFARAW